MPGEDKQEDVARGIRKPRGAYGSTGAADWENANAEILRDLIAKASLKGGALRFGYTRDGGAYSVGVYYGDDYWTDYIRPGEDIDTYLRDLIASFEDVGIVAPQRNGARRKRS